MGMTQGVVMTVALALMQYLMQAPMRRSGWPHSWQQTLKLELQGRATNHSNHSNSGYLLFLCL